MLAKDQYIATSIINIVGGDWLFAVMIVFPIIYMSQQFKGELACVTKRLFQCHFQCITCGCITVHHNWLYLGLVHVVSEEVFDGIMEDYDCFCHFTFLWINDTVIETLTHRLTDCHIKTVILKQLIKVCSSIDFWVTARKPARQAPRCYNHIWAEPLDTLSSSTCSAYSCVTRMSLYWSAKSHCRQ